MPAPASLPLDDAPDALPWPLLDEEDVAADELLADVARRCGLDAVRFLLARCGESTRTVPKCVRGRLPAWLDDVAAGFGPDLVRVLVELRGGEAVYLPSPRSLDERAKRRRVRQEYDGNNAGALAEHYHVSPRTVVTWALART